MSGDQKNLEKTILIVDDTELNREILSIIFSVDYQIEFANNGIEALKIIREKDPNLVAVLLDYQMPEMNGLEFLRKVREEGLLKKVPVFLITAGDDDTLAQQSFELGVMDFIKRPISAYVVQRRVLSIIELYETREKLDEILKKQKEQIKELVAGLISSLSTALTLKDGPEKDHVRRLRLIITALLDNSPVSEMFGHNEINEIIKAFRLLDEGEVIALWPPLRETKEESSQEKDIEVNDSQPLSLLDNLPNSPDSPIFTYARAVFKNQRKKEAGDQGSGHEDENELPIWLQLIVLAELIDYLSYKQSKQDGFDFTKIENRILNNEFGSFNPHLLESFVQNSKNIEILYQPK
ncbi:MAG: response regulator [Burkholderiales bacterium]|nr:response regulator [Burkholderiales bacterium]